MFEIDPESGVIKACPAGHDPVVSNFNEKQNVYTAKFSKIDCQSCPLLDQCPVQQQKKFNTVRFTQNKRQVDIIRSNMKSERLGNEMF